MKKMKQRETSYKVAVDIEGLAGLLSCGETTARRIGADAEARINIGRRVLYSVDKVQEYIKRIAC